MARLRLKSSLNAEPFYRCMGHGAHWISAGLKMAGVKMRKGIAQH